MNFRKISEFIFVMKNNSFSLTQIGDVDKNTDFSWSGDKYTTWRSNTHKNILTFNLLIPVSFQQHLTNLIDIYKYDLCHMERSQTLIDAVQLSFLVNPPVIAFLASYSICSNWAPYFSTLGRMIELYTVVAPRVDGWNKYTKKPNFKK